MRSPQGLIASQGYVLSRIDLEPSVRESVVGRDWAKLDQAIRVETSPGGRIFERMREFARFSEIEFIIAIRSSLGEPDEDGIWHDDGSRVLAFSLSVTLDHESVEGGVLEIRKRATPQSETDGTAVLPTPSFGTIIVFATGHQGYEHRINRVIQGERIIIAGWCT